MHTATHMCMHTDTLTHMCAHTVFWEVALVGLWLTWDTEVVSVGTSVVELMFPL